MRATDKTIFQRARAACSHWLVRVVSQINVWTSPVGCTAVDARKLREHNHGLSDEVEWYKMRCRKIGEIQKYMRDPERKAVCDILANGTTHVF